MSGRRTTICTAVATGAIAVLFVTVAAATPASTRGCAQFRALKSVFPSATAVGLTSRTRVRRAGRRDPVLPGYCATWLATYREGAGIDREEADANTSLTLYKTHKQALRAFEQTSGRVKRLADGALVRLSDNRLGMAAGKRTVRVASIYRNVLINSHSTADVTPIWGPDQLRLHRRMQAGVHAMAR